MSNNDALLKQLISIVENYGDTLKIIEYRLEVLSDLEDIGNIVDGLGDRLEGISSEIEDIADKEDGGEQKQRRNKLSEEEEKELIKEFEKSLPPRKEKSKSNLRKR